MRGAGQIRNRAQLLWALSGLGSVLAISTLGCSRFTGEASLSACTDALDNDGDGQVDCSDRDCRAVSACGVAAERDAEPWATRLSESGVQDARRATPDGDAEPDADQPNVGDATDAETGVAQLSWPEADTTPPGAPIAAETNTGMSQELPDAAIPERSAEAAPFPTASAIPENGAMAEPTACTAEGPCREHDGDRDSLPSDQQLRAQLVELQILEARTPLLRNGLEGYDQPLLSLLPWQIGGEQDLYVSIELDGVERYRTETVPDTTVPAWAQAKLRLYASTDHSLGLVLYDDDGPTLPSERVLECAQLPWPEGPPAVAHEFSCEKLDRAGQLLQVRGTIEVLP